MLVQNTSEKNITRLVPVKPRQSVGGTSSGAILRTSLQGQNSPAGKVCKMRRNSTANNPNVSLVARSRIGSTPNAVVVGPRTPQARAPIHQDSLQRTNSLPYSKNSPGQPVSQLSQLSERIKQVTAKQRQQIQNEQQQKQQVMAVTPMSRTPQTTTQGTVQRRAAMGNFAGRQQQQPQQQQQQVQRLQQLQQLQQATQLQQQQLHQRHTVGQQNRQNAVAAAQVEEPMEVDPSENEQLERLSQHNSSGKSDPSEESSSESVAYLQQEIDDPSTAIVQSQITGNEAKMLVILENGEQRLITFEVPKEDCTVQDLLEQVMVNHDI